MWQSVSIALVVAVSCGLASAEVPLKDLYLKALVAAAPAQRASYDPDTGRFGEGIWICQDQQRMYPLATVYATEGPGNPFYKDAELLDVIMKAGDALIDDMDENGQWEFRKKDGSTWGMIHMPWTYSRWARAFALIRDDMPEPRRQKWEAALTLGYGQIAQHAMGGIHNIPTHHAMGLYVAGKAMGRADWCEQAAAFLRRVAAEQRPGGYWSEGAGPVVGYNFVYTDALGTYYAVSGDREVLDALVRAARFHRRFTYPDGSDVETIDERNPYHRGCRPGNVGFTFTPAGWAFLKNQWTNLAREKLDAEIATRMDDETLLAEAVTSRLSADLLASLLLYGGDYLPPEAAADAADGLFILEEDGAGRAAVLTQGPWTVCVSAYTAPIPESRWLQDRQNLVSAYHRDVGLILGGGNTKLQPAWSTFTVGDTALLRHEPGDTDPDFLPKGEFHHVPASAQLTTERELGLDLAYGPESCRVRVVPLDDRTLTYRVDATTASGLPVAAHLTLLPRLGELLVSAAGRQVELGETPFAWTPEEIAGQFAYAGCRFTVPAAASLHWPATRHNPYRKDGHAGAGDHRIELRIPFTPGHPAQTVTIEVAAPGVAAH
ncbi:MAG: hypothetical protein JXR94_07055 [Candidatus Hydrogenedentes bacterium]|nr:hypothetical protein [Candidatus Hydrogenedentota bacterium]